MFIKRIECYGKNLSVISLLKFFIIISLIISGLSLSLYAETYYVDPVNGNDADNGISETTPWKTAININANSFLPGDKILFKRGTILSLQSGYDNSLKPKGSGTAGNPITLGAYGNGERPKIFQNGNDTLIFLKDQSYWIIEDLTLYGDKDNPNSRNKRGVYVIADQQDVYGITIRNLTLQDIIGLDKKFGQGSGGIKLWSKNTETVVRKFHDVLIENNIITNVHRSGIEFSTSATKPEFFNVDPEKKWLDIIVRNNTLTHIGGDAIVIDGTLNALVEYNIVNGAAKISNSYNAGIWARNAIGTIFQYNVVHDVRLAPGTSDGMAFDVDWYTYDTLYQYNYSYDNEGGFLLLCTNLDPAISDKTRATVRYNISVNDGAVSKSLFTICYLDARNINIYNNTFYIDYASQGNIFSFYNNPIFNTRFSNNIFYNATRYRIDFNGDKEYIQGAAFDSNTYYGNFINIPSHFNAITDNPELLQPGLTNYTYGYQLTESSPARNNGSIIADNGGRDYWGNPLPFYMPPDRGAHQFTEGQIPPSPPEQMIHYWNFDEGGGKEAFDSVGSAHGAINGAFYTTGKNGTALYFSGNSDYIDLGFDDITPSWTICMWVKRRDNSYSNATLMGSSNSYLKLEQYNNTNKVGITQPGVSSDAYNYSAPIEIWAHLAFVNNGADTELYVNGTYQDSINKTLPGPMRRISATGADAILGTLDEVKVFNYALNSTELQEAMQGDIPPAPAPGMRLISKSNWSLMYVDSEELVGVYKPAIHLFDDDKNTIWHTEWYLADPPHPHEIQIDLGDHYTINEFTYLPRQSGSMNGTIKDYEFYISSNGVDWDLPVASGSFLFVGREKKQVRFKSKTGRYIRLVALSEVNGNPWTSGAEIDLLRPDPEDTTPPQLTAPPDILNAEQSSYAGASVNLGTPIVTDDRDPDPLVFNDSTGAFPRGETIVTWTAIDAGGNIATATQRVTVVDTTPPNLIVPPDITAEQNSPEGSSVALGKYLVTDNGDPNPEVTNDRPDIFPPGATTVTWTATDVSGNTATDRQIVKVVDTTKPEIKVNLLGVSSDDELYEVRYIVDDLGDPAPVVSAYLKFCGNNIPVKNAQLIEIEFDDDECEIELDEGRLEITADKVTLEVTATDASGNVARAEIARSTPFEIPDLDEESKSIRVMSYNINHGLNIEGKLDLQGIAAAIKRENPDIVALQEVDRNESQAEGGNQAAVLAGLTGMHFAFEPNQQSHEGVSGNAILSRYPFKVIENIELPGEQGCSALFTEVDLSYLYGAGSRIIFISTQLDHGSQEKRIESIDKIESYLSSLAVHPVILAGDFNAAPYSETLKKAKQNWIVDDRGQALLTFPAHNPTEQFDYILFKGSKDWFLSTTYVPYASGQSDHKPIVYFFNLNTTGMTKPPQNLIEIDQTQWSLLYADSEELIQLDGAADNLFDGNINTFWHTELSPTAEKHPHEIQIDLGRQYSIHGFTYIPRQLSTTHAPEDEDESYAYSKGTMAGYAFYISNDLSDWGEAVIKGSLGSFYSDDKRQISFAGKPGRYIRLVSLAEIHHNPWTSGAELAVLTKIPGPADNLALYKPVAVSSMEAPHLSGSLAVDGILSTRWASAYSDSEHITVDLEMEYAIGRIIIFWETAYGKEYKIQVSNNALTWIDAYHETNGDGAKDDFILNLADRYRYIRMWGISRATSWGYSIYEIQVYKPGGGPIVAPKTIGAIIPKPAHSEEKAGSFYVTDNTDIYVQGASKEEEDEIAGIAQYLVNIVNPSTGYNLQVIRAVTPPPAGNIYLTTLGGDPGLGDEGYNLLIEQDGIELTSYRPAGLFRGIQTIRQLLPPEIEHKTVQNVPWTVKCGAIQDEPAYEWRGFMFDVCRHFFSMEKVKQYIDILAYYKMNVFHWHITEDQGWRAQVDRYPDLTNIGAWRGSPPYGGWYTKEEMAEVVAYAADRYIEVIPEIEMPGHSTAALASYKWLMCDPINYDLKVRESWGVSEYVYCAGKESTIIFLQDILDEIVEIFPSRIIHLGGDEAPKGRWNQCPHCQARITALGLADSHELQRWFMNRIAWYLYNVHGRNVTGWSEGGVINEGMPPGTQGQFWYYGMTVKQMAELGYDIVNSHYLRFYLDLNHSLSTMYAYDIKEGTDPAYIQHILGIETPIWTEHVDNEQKLDDRVFPRLLSVAENGWTVDVQKDYTDFRERLSDNLNNLVNMGIEYGGLEE